MASWVCTSTVALLSKSEQLEKWYVHKKIYATAVFQGVPVVCSRELFGFSLLVIAPVESLSFLETVLRQTTIQVII